MRARGRASSSWPVMTNPLSSRTTWSPSQSVRGDAPMKTNSQLAVHRPRWRPCRGRDQDEPSRCPSPGRGATSRPDSAPRSFGAALMRSTRYCDMVASSEPPRTSERDRFGEAGQVEGGLPGRVRRADDVDVVAVALARLAGIGAVVDAAAGQLVEAGRGEPPVRDPGGHDHRPGLDLDRRRRSTTARTGPRASRPTTSRASTISAPKRGACAMARWVRSAPVSPLGEPEVVLDRRALPGLATGRLALDDHGAEAFGRGVHGGGQPGRPGPDDADVVQRLLGGGAQAEGAGQLERRSASAARPRRGSAPGAGRRASPRRVSTRRRPSSSRSTSYQR